MNPPVRLRILDALVALINDIVFDSPSLGRSVSLVAEHTRGAVGARERHAIVINEKATPWEGEDRIAPPVKTDEGVRVSDWPLIIQGFDDGADDVYGMAAAVVRTLTQHIIDAGPEPDDLLGLKAGSPLERSPALEIRLGLPVVAPPDERSPDPCFWLPLTIILVEDRLDPFAWSQV